MGPTGAGRTFRAAGRAIPPDLSIAGMVEDGIEVSEWLRRRLGKAKIVLVGWSWGSI